MEKFDLGLKDALKNNNKLRMRSFLRNLRWELRYAWRRAWCGYDDLDFIECQEMFRRRMIRILEEFADHGSGLLNIPSQSEHYEGLLQKFPDGCFDEEHTKLIYQTMIMHLEMMNEDNAEKALFGKNVYDDYDDYEVGCRTLVDLQRIARVQQQNKDAFMKLFSLFYFDLWD